MGKTWENYIFCLKKLSCTFFLTDHCGGRLGWTFILCHVVCHTKINWRKQTFTATNLDTLKMWKNKTNIVMLHQSFIYNENVNTRQPKIWIHPDILVSSIKWLNPSYDKSDHYQIIARYSYFRPFGAFNLIKLLCVHRWSWLTLIII